MIRINLAAEGRRLVKKAPTDRFKTGFGGLEWGEWALLAGIFLGLLISAGWWMQKRSEVAHRQAEVEAARQEVRELEPIIREVEEYEAKKADLERKINIIKDLKRNQRGPVRLLDLISRNLPELLWLDNMTLRGNNIDLKGHAFNTNAIASFIENLNRVPEFQEPVLKDISKQRGEIFQFALTFNFTMMLPEEEESGEATGG
jgi:type IV pilus assembly protein PilN